MKGKRIVRALFIMILALTMSIGVFACSKKDDSGNGGGGGDVTPPEPDKPVYSAVIDGDYKGDYTDSLARRKVSNGITTITFTNPEPADNPENAKWGFSSTTVKVTTTKYKYLVAKIVFNDAMGGIKIKAKNEVYVPFGEFKGTGLFVCDLSEYKNGIFIADSIDLGLEIVTVANADKETSIAFESLAFCEAAPIVNEFANAEGLTLTNATATAGDSLMFTKTGGDSGKITLDGKASLVRDNFVTLTALDVSGTYSLNLIPKGKSAISLIANSSAANTTHRIDLSDKGVADVTEFSLEITFSDSIALAALEVSGNQILSFNSFDENNITRFDDRKNTLIEHDGGKMKISVEETDYCDIGEFYNVTAFPTLEIDISEIGAGATFSASVQVGEAVMTAISSKATAGKYSVDLYSLGLIGNTGYNLRLYVNGKINDNGDVPFVKISSIKSTAKNVAVRLPIIKEDFSGEVTWSGDAAASYNQGKMTVTQNQTTSGITWSCVSKTFKADVTKYPYLKMEVQSCVEDWGLKGYVGKALPEDNSKIKTFQSDNSKTGTGYYKFSELPDIGGGIQTVTVQIWSIGARGTANVVVSALESVTEVPKITFTAPTFANVTLGTEVSYAVSGAAGGVSNYVYTLKSGSLPVGLTLNNGVISGTPSIAGTQNFVLQVTDGFSSADATCSITVDKGTYTAPAKPIAVSINIDAIKVKGDNTSRTLQFAIVPKGADTALLDFKNAEADGSYTFTGLTQNSYYDIYARLGGDDNYFASQISVKLEVQAKVTKTVILPANADRVGYTLAVNGQNAEDSYAMDENDEFEFTLTLSDAYMQSNVSIKDATKVGQDGNVITFKLTVTDNITLSVSGIVKTNLTVTYDYSGKKENESVTVAYGEKASHKLPVIADNNFCGWYTDSNYAARFDFNGVITQNTTLYAKIGAFIDEDFAGEVTWKGDATATYSGGMMDVVQPLVSPNYTMVAKTFTVNTANANYILINVTDFDYDWGLKAKIGETVTTLQGDCKFKGVCTYPLKNISGLVEGVNTIEFQLWTIGDKDKSHVKLSQFKSITVDEKMEGLIGFKGNHASIDYDYENTTATFNANGWYEASSKTFNVDVLVAPILCIEIKAVPKSNMLVYFEQTKTKKVDFGNIVNGFATLTDGEPWFNETGKFYIDLSTLYAGKDKMELFIMTEGENGIVTIGEISFLAELPTA